MNPMSTDAARAYLVREGSRYSDPEIHGYDEYDTAESARAHGWKARASWGLNGWDLGSWPLVVYMFRDRPAEGFTISSAEALGSLVASDHVGYELAEYIEGDLKVWRFPTNEMRSALVDTLAFWWWQNSGESWTAGLSIDAIPDHLRGPFSWARVDAVPA